MAATPSTAQDVSAVALLDEPVRRRLYEWVVAQGRDVGREEAAKSVGITRALAAFHLDRLVDGGLLDAGYQRLTGRTGPGAGRPARVYRRAEREIAVTLPPRRYSLVADVFATALQRIGDGAPPPELIEAAHEAGTIIAEAATGKGRGLLQILDAAGYEPAVDTDVIRLRNCPFDALVEEHRPLVCGTNLALAQGILDGASDSADTDYQPRLDPQPGYCCVVFSRQVDSPGR